MFSYWVPEGPITDTIRDFDADPAGGQDLIDISGFGIASADFPACVSVQYVGPNAVVAIDGTDVVTLLNIDGLGPNLLTASDFDLL